MHSRMRLPLATPNCHPGREQSNKKHRFLMAETEANSETAVANGDGPQVTPVPPQDIDPIETKEWLDSLEYVLNTKGPERVKQLLAVLDRMARHEGDDLPYAMTTSYINTIHHT